MAKARAARTVKRSPRRKTGTMVLTPRPVPWYDPRGITELSRGRVEAFAEALGLAAEHKIDHLDCHRNRCLIVRSSDGDADCTCIPLIIYTGARA